MVAMTAPFKAALIDGQNLLHAVRCEPGGQGVTRKGLCNLLARWADVHGGYVFVVFDGAPPKSAGSGEPAGRVQVAFSGPEKTADEVLIERIRACSWPRRLLVVSSDRQIRKAAGARRCPQSTSEAFAEALLKPPAKREARPDEPREKHRGLRPGQAARWLEQFGLGPG